MGKRLLGIDASTGFLRGVMLPVRGRAAASDVVSIPAVVSFRGGRLAVGEPALMMAAVVPDTIFPGPLRILGRKPDDPMVSRYAARLGLEAKVSKGELRWILTDEPDEPGLGSIEAVTALLKHLLEMLDRATERHAVVAVPSWLGEAGRSQLIRAAANAGIVVRRFVTRPVAIAASLTADRQLLGRGIVVDTTAGGVAAALVEGRSRSLRAEQVEGRDSVGGDDILAEIVRSMAPEGACRQSMELLRQGAQAVLKTLEEATSAERSIDTPDGKVTVRLEQWELDLLMGSANHELAGVLETLRTDHRRLPTWFAGELSAHRVLRATAGERAQGPLRHVDDSAATLGAARLASLIDGAEADISLEDGESLLEATGRSSNTGRPPSEAPEESVVSGPEARREGQTYRPQTNVTVKDVTTNRARATTRRLSPEERSARRRRQNLQAREAQKGPLPTRGGTSTPASEVPPEKASEPPPSVPTAGANPSESPPRPKASPVTRAESEPPPRPPRASSSPPKPPQEPPKANPSSTPPPPDAPRTRPPLETAPVPEKKSPSTFPPPRAMAPPQADDTDEPRIHDPEGELTARRRLVTEPGMPAEPRAPATDVPLPPTSPRPRLAVRSPSGPHVRRRTAPQISLGTAPEAGDDQTRAASAPPPRSVPPDLASVPPRISELPAEKSSLRAPDSSAPRPSSAPGGRLSLPPGALWPEAGTIANPIDAAGILDMAILRELRREDLDPVALPVLLRRIIGRADMVGTLSLVAGRTELHLRVQDGCVLLTRVDHNALRRAFDEPEGSWSFEPDDAVDVAKHPLAESKKLRTLGLEGLRRMLRHTERSDLKATFGHRFDEAPAIHPHKATHPRRLRLDRREVRAVEQHVDGELTVRELTRQSGLGAGNTLQVLALLDLFEILRWPHGDPL